MNFLNNLKWKLTQFMQGRSGPDQLTKAQLWAGLALYVIGILLRWQILVYLALAMYIWAVYRMFSRNRVARAKENQAYLQLWAKIKDKPAQYKMRFQNRKEFKYFHCPKCHTVLRTRRGGGKKQVNCPKCHHQFEIKS